MPKKKRFKNIVFKITNSSFYFMGVLNWLSYIVVKINESIPPAERATFYSRHIIFDGIRAMASYYLLYLIPIVIVEIILFIFLILSREVKTFIAVILFIQLAVFVYLAFPITIRYHIL